MYACQILGFESCTRTTSATVVDTPRLKHTMRRCTRPHNDSNLWTRSWRGVLTPPNRHIANYVRKSIRNLHTTSKRQATNRLNSETLLAPNQRRVHVSAQDTSARQQPGRPLPLVHPCEQSVPLLYEVRSRKQRRPSFYHLFAAFRKTNIPIWGSQRLETRTESHLLLSPKPRARHGRLLAA